MACFHVNRHKSDLIIIFFISVFLFSVTFLFQGQPTYDTKNISTNINLKVTAVTAALCNLGDGGYVKKVKERIKEQANKKKAKIQHVAFLTCVSCASL